MRVRYQLAWTRSQSATVTIEGTCHAYQILPPDGTRSDHSRRKRDPAGRGARLTETRSLPDLFGTHPASSELWLVEVKGSRRLGARPRSKGAKQLDVGALVPAPHQKVLCGTSLERRLFMMTDVADASATGTLGDASGTDDLSPSR